MEYKECRMKIYILKPKLETKRWSPYYDKVFSFVICAASVKDARSMAAEAHADEGADAWLDSKYTTCKELTCNEPKIIVREFMPG
jgi:hypothetical protein